MVNWLTLQKFLNDLDLWVETLHCLIKGLIAKGGLQYVRSEGNDQYQQSEPRNL